MILAFGPAPRASKTAKVAPKTPRGRAPGTILGHMGSVDPEHVSRASGKVTRGALGARNSAQERPTIPAIGGLRLAENI